MNPRDIDLQYLFDLYAAAFNQQGGSQEKKHAAGLLAVVEGAQPHVIYPRAKKPEIKI